MANSSYSGRTLATSPGHPSLWMTGHRHSKHLITIALDKHEGERQSQAKLREVRNKMTWITVVHH